MPASGSGLMSIFGGRNSRRRRHRNHREDGGVKPRTDRHANPGQYDAIFVPLAGIALALLLAIFGGASRNDLWVQPVVQLGAIVVAAALLCRPGSAFPVAKMGPLGWGIGGLAAVMAIQLIPLPPALWRELPGRRLEADISTAVGLAKSWRPLSTSPDNTLSSLVGMIVPAAALIVLVHLPLRLLGRLMWLAAAIGVLELILGLGQLATGEGVLFFYPRTDGTVTGFFHNRNHFAIFLGTMPAVLAYLALAQRDRLDRREPLWAGFALALALNAFGVILTGSRIGFLVLMLSGIGAGLMVWRTEPRIRARVSRPMTPRRRIAAIAICAFFCLLLLGLLLGRSDTSLTRLEATNLGEEGRVAIFRSLLGLIGQYFPFGSGFGTFDQVYRMIEPEEKLRLSYLNHAHNDFIEMLIEGGLVCFALVAAMAIVAIVAAFRVWRPRGVFDPARDLARVGSIVAAALLLGSVSDYPLRTPVHASWMTCALFLLFRKPLAGAQQTE